MLEVLPCSAWGVAAGDLERTAGERWVAGGAVVKSAQPDATVSSAQERCRPSKSVVAGLENCFWAAAAEVAAAVAAAVLEARHLHDSYSATREALDVARNTPRQHHFGLARCGVGYRQA